MLRLLSCHHPNLKQVLVNCAGGMIGRGSLTDVDIDEFMKAFDLNVRGPLQVAQAFMRASRRHDPDKPKTVISLPSGAAHLPYAPGGASYACSKLAGAKILEYIGHEKPTWNVFNMQPGVVATELARQTGRNAPDSPELPAGFAVWLAAHPRARELSGRFVWANWDVDEVLLRSGDIAGRGLLTLGLKGWAEEYSGEDLMRIVASMRKKD